MPITFTDLIRISHNKSVMTYYGKEYDGREFFAYILCKPEDAKKMYHDYETGNRRPLIEYGEVIHKDYISEPDAKALKFLKEYLEQV